MMVPIRCITCGKPIAHLWEDYEKRVKKGENAAKVMTELGLERYCCRAVFMGTVDCIENIGAFSKT